MQSPALATAVAALLAACPPSLIPQWIQDLNTLVGLIGFAITIVVWWQVRSVRLSFQAKARLPGLADEICASRKELDKASKAAGTTRQDLHQMFGGIATLLATAGELMPSRSRAPVNEAILAVKAARVQLDSTPRCHALDLGKTLGALKAAETGVFQTSLALDWK
ncbi:hypothetical protein [Mitsuaria sp. 7]|uniref:hypothetical protein n=1 Tax=Mitsuaria sp. 7 TaxID=1658665 RepID=UPI0007DDCA2E|nr:hypothetical protein [Mitsuaria sp. 7]ANH66910.1 hypothetical protein ABE85_03820 [Mitsuaria sp. 7]